MASDWLMDGFDWFKNFLCKCSQTAGGAPSSRDVVRRGRIAPSGALPTDVADPAQTKALAQAALSHFGGIDVWINMAGFAAVGPFERIPVETHRRLIEVNLIGVMNGTNAVLPHMLRRGRGVII